MTYERKKNSPKKKLLLKTTNKFLVFCCCCFLQTGNKLFLASEAEKEKKFLAFAAKIDAFYKINRTSRRKPSS